LKIPRDFAPIKYDTFEEIDESGSSTVNIVGDYIRFRNGKVVNTPFKLNQ
jgi:hypothetical protein